MAVFASFWSRGQIWTNHKIQPSMQCFQRFSSDLLLQAPIDFVLRGSVREAGTDHDEPIGLQLIPGYAMDMFRLKSKDFGAGQTRSRIYFIMVHHSVGDQNTLDHIGALLQTFAASMPATSVWDAVDYVKCCKHDWTPEEEDLVLQLQRALGEP
ncbi:unnamed protein product, partial [Durusdinium trenchii]